MLSLVALLPTRPRHCVMQLVGYIQCFFLPTVQLLSARFGLPLLAPLSLGLLYPHSLCRWLSCSEDLVLSPGHVQYISFSLHAGRLWLDSSHIYNKNLPLGHTLKQSCPQFTQLKH